jgi:hypothetical protein
MKKGKQYSVLFRFAKMDGEINMIIDVANGETIEKAVQKKNQTKREVVILSKVLLNEWENVR